MTKSDQKEPKKAEEQRLTAKDLPRVKKPTTSVGKVAQVVVRIGVVLLIGLTPTGCPEAPKKDDKEMKELDKKADEALEESKDLGSASSSTGKADAKKAP